MEKFPITNRFDKAHADKGGANKLLELYNEGLSNPDIAKHFSMSEQGLSAALKKILKELEIEYMAYPWRRLKSDLNKLSWRN